MSIEYRLTLAGDIPLDDVAQIAAPDATETSTLSGKRMLTSAHYEDYGYVIDITSGVNGYYDAEDGDTLWVWEPDTYVDLNFHMRKDTLNDKGIPNMLTTVTRVLNARPEDAALTMNGNWLLLTRTAGVLRKHNSAQWYDKTYNNILPG